MGDVIVVMGASCVQGLMEHYLRQLREAAIEFYVSDITGQPYLNRGAFLSERIAYMREVAHKFSGYKSIVFSDAHDVLFYGTRDELISRIPQGHLLHAAEKNCYPDKSIAGRIPNVGPWRFVNGGLSVGSPELILEWCDMAEREFPDRDHLDQLFMNRLLADGKIQIDHRTELFFCLYGGYPELDFRFGKPHNMMYGTWPLFIHANGKWDASGIPLQREESLI